MGLPETGESGKLFSRFKNSIIQYNGRRSKRRGASKWILQSPSLQIAYTYQNSYKSFLYRLYKGFRPGTRTTAGPCSHEEGTRYWRLYII